MTPFRVTRVITGCLERYEGVVTKIILFWGLSFLLRRMGGGHVGNTLEHVAGAKKNLKK